MILGAHWGYWLGLAVALIAGALELVRRGRRRERVFFAALLEQGRRELEVQGRPAVRRHRPAYRPDQTLLAIQQRLSRHWGKHAFSARVAARIKEALRGVDDEK